MQAVNTVPGAVRLGHVSSQDKCADMGPSVSHQLCGITDDMVGKTWGQYTEPGFHNAL
jgi:hypothetical protein